MNQSTSHNPQPIPAHVAIIMDGNGRWAKARGLERTDGHARGVDTVRQITEIASATGVKYLTLYTFSTENWNRPQPEVDALMHLIVMAIERETPDLIKNNIRLTTIGNIERMPDEARRRLTRCVEETSRCTGMTLILALSYSARWEMVEAARRLATLCAEGKIAAADIDDTLFADHLSTAGIPDPDLLIRTGGEARLSNFLLWQAAYAELYFTDKYWPDFSKEDFTHAINEYQSRERRFGKTSEQITQ